MTLTTIYLERSIDASHVLPDHPGKCSRLHGHRYRFEVWLRGAIDVGGSGMLVDFLEVKRCIDEWDHAHLNDLVDFAPTAELLAREMHRRLTALLPSDGDSNCIVRLWETGSAYAEYGSLV